MARQSYAERIAAGMEKYLAANPGASDAEARRFARGHGNTGEHGVTITAVGQDIVISFRDANKLGQALRAAEKYGERAGVTIVGKNGQSVTAFENKGHKGGTGLNRIRDMGAGGDLYGGVAESGGDHYDLDEAIGGAANVAEYQLIVY